MNEDRMRIALEQARRHEGLTLFDEIVEVVENHGRGGTESDDGVVLELL